MIPSNITRNHIIKAIREISQQEIPPRRQSRDFILVFENKSFPPKYVISVANRYANDSELDPSVFSGGQESNTYLTKLGFEISKKAAQRPKVTKRVVKPVRPNRFVQTYRHDERCPACKETIKKILERMYGEVYPNYTLRFGTLPENFVNSPLYNALRGIYQALQGLRSHFGFVRARTLPPMDYYIPNPGLIVEFDESQHFTKCRKLALSKYPADLSLGFDRQKWVGLCDQIDAKDNDPPYRDEQRAWYDTLRDLLPSEGGLLPTVRLYAGERYWCLLDPNRDEDVELFRGLLEGRRPTIQAGLGIRLENGGKPYIATVIVEQYGITYNEPARKALLQEVVIRLSQQAGGAGIIVFPAGFFETSRDLNGFIVETCDWLANDLQKHEAQHLALCVGIDGKSPYYSREEYRDQLSVTVTSKGLVSIARKFYPTKEEAFYLRRSPRLEVEANYPRIFEVGGHRFYPAVCYDVYGIKHGHVTNPDVDAILNLVHHFYPGESWNYFVRLGFAGASYAWQCPVFGSTVFFNRNVPHNFLSGVLSMRAEGNNHWRFIYNELRGPYVSFVISQSDKPSIRAVVRMYGW